jgi:hypothetical protein
MAVPLIFDGFSSGEPVSTSLENAIEARAMTKPDPEPGDNRRGAVAGLLIAIVLLAVGIWLAHELTAASKLQDCVMSGRTNCNEIEPAR